MFVSPMATSALYSFFLWLPTAIMKGKELFQAIIDATKALMYLGRQGRNNQLQYVLKK